MEIKFYIAFFLLTEICNYI